MDKQSTKYITRSSKKNKKNPLQFRSSIAPLVKHINKLKPYIKKRHIQAMKETPFKLIFMALYNGKLTGKTETRKGNNNIAKILERCDPSRKGFLIGNECLSITAEDISAIFGVPDKAKVQKKRTLKKAKSTLEKDSVDLFMDKYFGTVKKIKKNHIVDQLMNIVKVGTDEAVRDFTVLTCSLICCTLFFHNSTGILAKNIIKSLYTDLNRIGWASKILETLMMNVEKYQNAKSAPGGCTLALLYWMVEHVQLTSMRKEAQDEIPRAVRWNIDDIDKAILKTDLSSINVEKITKTITLSKIEEKIIKGQIYDGNVEVVLKNEEDVDDDFVDVDIDVDDVVEAAADDVVVEATDDDVEAAANDVVVEATDDDVEATVADDDNVDVEAVVDDENVDVEAELDELRKKNKKLKRKLKKSHGLKEKNEELKKKLEKARKKAKRYRRKFKEATRTSIGEEATKTTKQKEEAAAATQATQSSEEKKDMEQQVRYGGIYLSDDVPVKDMNKRRIELLIQLLEDSEDLEKIAGNEGLNVN